MMNDVGIPGPAGLAFEGDERQGDNCTESRKSSLQPFLSVWNA